MRSAVWALASPTDAASAAVARSAVVKRRLMSLSLSCLPTASSRKPRNSRAGARKGGEQALEPRIDDGVDRHNIGFLRDRRPEMTGRGVALAVVVERRTLEAAELARIGAAGMEVAARRWGDRARHVAFEGAALAAGRGGGGRGGPGPGGGGGGG